jgi:hypothetical protein
MALEYKDRLVPLAAVAGPLPHSPAARSALMSMPVASTSNGLRRVDDWGSDCRRCLRTKVGLGPFCIAVPLPRDISCGM